MTIVNVNGFLASDSHLHYHQWRSFTYRNGTSLKVKAEMIDQLPSKK